MKKVFIVISIIIAIVITGYIVYNLKDKFIHEEIVKKNINPRSELGQKLIEGGFIYEGSPLIHDVDQVGKLRNIKGFLLNATSLHIFVVTNACNLSCVYCQANKGKRNPQLMMTEEKSARRSVRIIFSLSDPFFEKRKIY